MHFEKENELFSLAADVVNFTSRNLFLTGKAGTGKTTFLKYICDHSHKNSVVLAPTGVAAINAGGVTMHSFFQLPFVPFLPERKYAAGGMESIDRHSLIKKVRFTRQKIDLLNELELLIIDEVSMLRADMLDAMDEILKHYRGNHRVPFGGLQVLFIGDLFQLPPVVPDAELEGMRGYYESPFFFSAKSLEKNPPLCIELKKIYRQNEESFINLLNNVRNNVMTEDDFSLLHQRFLPHASVAAPGSITLATHNYIADDINQRELKKLKGKLFCFKGELKGNFSDKALPAELDLHLKEGAQVMFVKNDSSPEKRYFNGKLATITRLDEEGISVTMPGEKEELRVEKEKWKSIRYLLNKNTGKVDEEELGSFMQYPLRLAWAVTIHKSQGLTFDQAVIDAGRSFAPGQVYVALSRCRTLNGVTLLSKIAPSNITLDERIVDYMQKSRGEDEIRSILSEEKPKYAAQVLIKTFRWEKVLTELEIFSMESETKIFTGKDAALSAASRMLLRAKEQQEVSKKFIAELERKLAETVPDRNWLTEKVTGAKKYFSGKIKEELLAPLNGLQSYLHGKAKVRKYGKRADELEDFLWKKINDIQHVVWGDLSLDVAKIERIQDQKPLMKIKAEKGMSKCESLNFYKQGMKIEEIAKHRGMAVTTIEGHLAEFVPDGEVDVFDFVNGEQLEKIKSAVTHVGAERLAPLKAELGDALSYGQLKIALNYLKKKN